MSELTERIKRAQVEAGENVVIKRLQERGLISTPEPTDVEGLLMESLDRCFSALSKQETKIDQLEKRVARLEASYRELEAQLMPEKAMGWPHK